VREVEQAPAPPRTVVAWPGARHERPGAGRRRPPRRRRSRIGLLAAVALGTVLAVLALAGAARAAYQAWTVVVPAAGGRYVEAYVGQPNALNPLLAAPDPSDRDFLPLLFAGLTRVAPDGQVLPDLAERWDVSPDGRSYTFHLRAGLRWSDGTALDADDVAFTFDALRAPDFPADADYLAPWREVRTEALDDRTVRCTLARPWAGFLEAASLGIVPRAPLGSTSGSGWLDHPFNAAPIGAGPYRVADSTIEELVLVPNAWYHGPRPHLAELRFRLLLTPEAAVQAVQAGEADGVALRGGADVESLRAQPNLVVHQRADHARSVMLWLNNGAAPFDDRAVRAAVAHAVDRERLARDGGTGARTGAVAARSTPGSAAGGGTSAGATGTGPAGSASAALGEAAWGALPPTSWAYAAEAAVPRHAPERARVLLDAAGWRVGPGGTRARGGTPLEITLATNDDPARRRAAASVADDLRAVGFRVEVAVRPWAELAREELAQRRYQAVLLGQWTPTADPDGLRDQWRSDAVANLAGWRNPRADDLLAQGGTMTDPAMRRAAYTAFQALWAEEVPSVPLYYPLLTWVVRADFQGVDVSALNDGGDRLALLPSWYLQTARVFRGW
jgi:peptide/nickel transport system substrate-binding protein